MKQAFTPSFKKRSLFQFSGIRITRYLLLVVLSILFRHNLQAQSYVQVPTLGGIPSPASTPTFYYGPFSSLNVRSAILYPASELTSLPLPLSISTLGFKLNSPTNGGTQGYFKIYVIPTTDTNYTLNTGWSTIMQHPDIIEVYNSVFLTFSPISGYLDFNLTTPFSLQTGQGFYLVTDWDQGILPGINATYDCNTALSNSYQFAFNNSHSPQTPPTMLTTSSNYRPVLRLGYTGGPTGIIENNSGNSISVYPNPVQEQLYIDLGNFGETEVQATLQDVTGKIIKTEKLICKQNQINLNAVAPGIYLLHLSNATETVIKRIVKN